MGAEAVAIVGFETTAGEAGGGAEDDWVKLDERHIGPFVKEAVIAPRADLTGYRQLKIRTSGTSLWLYGAEIDFCANAPSSPRSILSLPPGACSPSIKLPAAGGGQTKVSLLFVGSAISKNSTDIEIWGSRQPTEDQLAKSGFEPEN